MPPSNPDDELGFAMPKPARVSKILIAIVLALAVAAAFVFGYLPRRRHHDDVAAAAAGAATGAADHGTPRVEVVKPTAAEGDRDLRLAGSVQPLEQTTVYPRVSGYVRNWLVDIGDKVVANQPLVEIDVPETDDQLAQARAQLAQARSQLAQAKAAHQFSQSNLTRYQGLSKDDVVAAVDVDQASAQAQNDEASVGAAKANIAAQQANVERLVEEKQYAKVLAPFAGKVIARSVERGALVSAGTSTPLYTIASMDTVRVFVQVPQSAAVAIHPGVTAKVTVRELPGRVFDGTVAHVSGVLDAGARTMNTEIRVPNADGALMSGMYVQVTLALAVPHQVLEIPATALYNDAQGTRVGVVGADGVLHLVPITIDRDTGATLQIASGLTGDERIVKVASASLLDGEPVEAVDPPPPPAPAK